MSRFFKHTPPKPSDRESHFVGHNAFEDYPIDEIIKESDGTYALRVNENYLLTVKGHNTEFPVYQKHAYYDPEIFARCGFRVNYPTTFLEKMDNTEKDDFDRKVAEFKMG
ncbi:MAG: hypothetical protein SFW66_03970 [Gammaproteobacteria bacterium]|nr:hypothetical protein [Gammaproteobacteria bacterium]